MHKIKNDNKTLLNSKSYQNLFTTNNKINYNITLIGTP